MCGYWCACSLVYCSPHRSRCCLPPSHTQLSIAVNTGSHRPFSRQEVDVLLDHLQDGKKSCVVVACVPVLCARSLLTFACACVYVDLLPPVSRGQTASGEQHGVFNLSRWLAVFQSKPVQESTRFVECQSLGEYRYAFLQGMYQRLAPLPLLK
jgi:hypothetical protein